MYVPGSKSMSNTQDGYFEPKFLRVFESEALNELRKFRAEEKKLNKEKNITTKPFVPSGYGKKL